MSDQGPQAAVLDTVDPVVERVAVSFENIADLDQIPEVRGWKVYLFASGQYGLRLGS